MGKRYGGADTISKPFMPSALTAVLALIACWLVPRDRVMRGKLPGQFYFSGRKLQQCQALALAPCLTSPPLLSHDDARGSARQWSGQQ
jgi:hypothetical protein